MMAPTSITEAINITDRATWRPTNGNGTEESDYKDWKLWDPPMTEVEKLLDSVTLAQLGTSETANKFPKRVKLSDSAVELVIRLGVPIARCNQWWPLDFNATGYVLGQPARNHIGHAHRIGTSIAQIGRARSLYILYGSNKTLDATKQTVVPIQRPSARPSKASSNPGLSDSVVNWKGSAPQYILSVMAVKV